MGWIRLYKSTHSLIYSPTGTPIAGRCVTDRPVGRSRTGYRWSRRRCRTRVCLSDTPGRGRDGAQWELVLMAARSSGTRRVGLIAVLLLPLPASQCSCHAKQLSNDPLQSLACSLCRSSVSDASLRATRKNHEIDNESVPIQLAQCWFPGAVHSQC